MTSDDMHDGSPPHGAGPDANGFVQTNAAVHGSVVNAVQNGNLSISYHHGGQELLAPWLLAEEVFEEAQAAPYFSQHWELVGRSELVEEMVSFSTGACLRGGVGVLRGTTGSGKTRVLRAVAAEFVRRSSGEVRVLPADASAGGDAARRLPEGAALLVLMEDVHLRTADLPGILAGIRRERPRAVVIVSVRQSGATELRQVLRRLRRDDASVSEWELGELPLRQAVALAAQVLGEGNERLARWLAGAVGDSAFLLVFSAVQIARGRIEARWLESDEDLRQQVLDAFVETTLAGPAIRTEDRALLRVVAALQPVRADEAEFLGPLTELLGVSEPVVRAQLDRLAGTGVLVRRRNSYRILPDLLGDVLLAEAAIDPHGGTPTGFLGEVLAATRGEALAHLLINAGRVDWQWTRLRPLGGALVEPLWKLVEHAYAGGDSLTRSNLLKVVRRVAAYQPWRVLALLRPVIERAAADEPHVLDDVPPVLAAVAQDQEYLGTALDLLWQIGRCDPRPAHANPDSALRTIGDLASYAPDKPLFYQEAVIDAVERWVGYGTTRAVERMPFALLDHVFATTAEHRDVEGWTLTVSRLPLVAERVATVRTRAFQVLLDAYGSTDPVRAGAAARTFAEAFRQQHGCFEESLLTMLSALAVRTRAVPPEPMVALAVRQSVHWCAAYGSPRVAAAAREVLGHLPDVLEHRLAVLLYSDAHEWAAADDHDAFEAAEASWSDRLAEAVDQTSGWPDSTAWEALWRLLKTGRRIFPEEPPGCGALVAGMTSGRPGRAAAFVHGALECDDSTVHLVLPAALRALWEDAPRNAEELAEDLLGTGRVAAIRAVVRTSTARSATEGAPRAQELAAARRMSLHADPTVRAEVLRLAVAMTHHPAVRRQAIDLLCTTPFSDLWRGAEEFSRAFFGVNALTWSELGPHRRAACLEQLATAPTWDGRRLHTVVAALSDAYEDEALELLLRRQEAWERDPAPAHTPLPYRWHATPLFTSSPRRRELLRTVVRWFEEPREEPWLREMYGVELFRLVAGGTYDSLVREVLLEALVSSGPVRAAAVAPLLGGAHEDFLWEEVDFVAEVLRAAMKESEELYRRVGGRMMSSVTCGLKTSSPGKPFQKDLLIQEKATAIRSGLSPGSPEDRLYAALQSHARGETGMALDAGEGFGLRRQW
ncbi:hypothetical protein [Streptomyces sp. NPDC058861]|uniref:hypothetical protein n=1 Tax=Streptomyces sp. NPDC058861 TaxID=3346653 RepID=UPI00367FA83A